MSETSDHLVPDQTATDGSSQAADGHPIDLPLYARTTGGFILDAGWVILKPEAVPALDVLKTRAVEDLGINAVKNLLACTNDSGCLYVRGNSSPPLRGRTVSYANLWGLHAELVALADRWELPLDDEGLSDLLQVSNDEDEDWLADAPEIPAFVQLAVAVNAAVRRDWPLWIGEIPKSGERDTVPQPVDDAPTKPTNEPSEANNSIESSVIIYDTNLIKNLQGHGGPVPTLEDKVEVPATKPTGYVELADRLQEETRMFRQQVADRLLPALKKEMPQRLHATHEDKKELVKWTNAELRRFGLAIKSPKTGNASNFVTDKGNHPEEGRFQLRSEGEGGKVETFSTPKLSVLLDVLELIEAPQREEGLVNWADRAKDASRSTRPRR